MAAVFDGSTIDVVWAGQALALVIRCGAVAGRTRPHLAGEAAVALGADRTTTYGIGAAPRRTPL